jgi:hypothetical protein
MRVLGGAVQRRVFICTSIRDKLNSFCVLGEFIKL